MNIESRLTALENKTTKTSAAVIVWLIDNEYNPLPEDERARLLDAARQDAGPDGTVIAVRLTGNISPDDV